MSIAAIPVGGVYQQDFVQVVSAPPSKDPASAQPAGGQFNGLPLPAPIKTDLANLATALQEGDFKQAQAAFSSLVADLAAEYQQQQHDSVGFSLLG